MSLSKLVNLVHEMSAGGWGERASRQQQPQSAATIALETTQGHFVLLCQLSYFIQRDEGWRRREVGKREKPS